MVYATLIQPCVQNVPGNIGAASPVGYTHEKAAPKVVQRRGGVTTSPTLLRSVLLLNQKKFLRLLLTVVLTDCFI